MSDVAVSPQRLEIYFRLSQMLASSLQIQEVLDLLLAEIVRLTGAERGFIVARARDAEDWQFRSVESEELLVEENHRVSLSVIDQVARTGQTVLTDDASADERFRERASVHLYQLRAILCAPLLRSGRVLGVIYIDNRVASGAFSSKTRQLLEDIAVPAAVAVENALLYESQKQTYEQVLDRARLELAATQTQLLHASKMSAVGQLAAGVAHEVNNPLGAISLNLSGMRDYSSDPQFARRLRLCETAVERCRKIVQGLLNFSAPQHQQQQCIRLSELVSDTLDLCAAELRESRVSLQVEVDPSHQVKGCPGEWQQVLLNLLLNAGDAMKEWEGERGVRLSSSLRDGQILLEVADTGPGIDQAHLEKIFEPFFTTRKVGQGVGLGLSICYQLAQKNQAQLSVRSLPNQGACFSIVWEPAA